MGQQSRKVKERQCKHCENQFMVNANELKRHANFCRRAKGVGLILPGAVERVDAKIVNPYSRPPQE